MVVPQVVVVGRLLVPVLTVLGFQLLIQPKEHPEKAPLIVVTLVGIVIDTSAVQPLKAWLSIKVTVEGIITSVNAVQPLKAW